MPSQRVKESVRQLREFGLLVGGILCTLSAWWLYRAKFGAATLIILPIGVLLVLLGAIFPRALRIPYLLWMGLAEALAFVMTRVILAFVFFLVVTPIGLLRKTLGGDPLRRRSKPAESYWWPYSHRQSDLKHYEKMF